MFLVYFSLVVHSLKLNEEKLAVTIAGKRAMRKGRFWC